MRGADVMCRLQQHLHDEATQHLEPLLLKRTEGHRARH